MTIVFLTFPCVSPLKPFDLSADVVDSNVFVVQSMMLYPGNALELQKTYKLSSDRALKIISQHRTC